MREKKNADGGASGTYDFTSLMGTDKKLLLKGLAQKLDSVVNADCCERLVNIWQVSYLFTVLVPVTLTIYVDLMHLSLLGSIIILLFL